MLKKNIKIFVVLTGAVLIVFGQNCSKAFQTISPSEANLNSRPNGQQAELPTAELSESERLGLKGRIAAADFAFPLDGSTDSFPKRLSDTKLFKNLADLEAADGLISYQVNMPLWSDGAAKSRWYALPEGVEKIAFNESGTWVFPVGSVLVKHFELRLNANTVRRLETRVFLNENTGWKGYSYKWRDDQTDADLLAGVSAVTETYTVEDIAGSRQQTWSYPSRAQCIQCHQSSGFVLGLRTQQLNRTVTFGSGGTAINQLKVLSDLKLISDDMPTPDKLDSFPQLMSTNASDASKARAYLSVNCGTCHQGATAPFSVKLNYSLANSEMNIVNVVANNAMGLGVGAVRIKPGKKEESTLFLRMNAVDGTRMPKVGSSVIDVQGIGIVGAWIDSL